jgi:hypothetical protein
VYKKFKKLPVWKKVLVFLFGSIVAFAAWFYYAVITDEQPQFFPLDDPKAEYRITKTCPVAQGWGKRHPELKGDGYCVEYTGDHVLMKEDNGNTQIFTITVGNSDVALEPLLGKKVKNIKGKFVSSSKQCIQDECMYINGPHVVLSIDSLEVVK